MCVSVHPHTTVRPADRAPLQTERPELWSKYQHANEPSPGRPDQLSPGLQFSERPVEQFCTLACYGTDRPLCAASRSVRQDLTSGTSREVFQVEIPHTVTCCRHARCKLPARKMQRLPEFKTRRSAGAVTCVQAGSRTEQLRQTQGIACRSAPPPSRSSSDRTPSYLND